MPDDRPIQSTTVDGVSVNFQTPQQQAEAAARAAEQRGLKRRRSLLTFLRIFGVSTRDRP